MSNVLSIYGHAVIDGGEPVGCELHVTQEMVDVPTRLPKPDPSWSMVDEAGHFHAAWQEGRHVEYPTLQTRSRPCDGACGDPSHEESYYVCRICEVEIRPGKISGPHYYAVRGPEEWECVVSAELPLLKAVSIRVTVDGDTEWFGVAQVIKSKNQSFESFEAVPRSWLTGASLLGRRRVAR